jgi:hypothetical protein
MIRVSSSSLVCVTRKRRTAIKAAALGDEVPVVEDATADYSEERCAALDIKFAQLCERDCDQR